jgi:hypothetical protein
MRARFDTISMVIPLHVSRPGYEHLTELPHCVQVSLTHDLLLAVLTTRRSVALVVRAWTLERTCYRRTLAPITEATILEVLVSTKTAAHAANNLTRRAYGFKQPSKGSRLTRVLTEADGWWARVEQEATGLRAAIRTERLAALELADRSL